MRKDAVSVLRIGEVIVSTSAKSGQGSAVDPTAVGEETLTAQEKRIMARRFT